MNKTDDRDYVAGDTVEVDDFAEDASGARLFCHEYGDKYGYGFSYCPPFTYVERAGEDLLVADRDGGEYEVSPEFVSFAEEQQTTDKGDVEERYLRAAAIALDIDLSQLVTLIETAEAIKDLVENDA